MLSNRDVYINLFVYGVAHAIIDAACIALTYIYCVGHGLDQSGIFTLVLVYNVLAFGFQPLLGDLIDGEKAPRGAALAGCAITALAAVFNDLSPVIVICAAGLGNAIFHAGAGAICLNLRPGMAAPSGIFVAPGALGVLLGTLSGRGGNFIGWPFALILLFLCAAMFLIRPPRIDYSRKVKTIEITAVKSFLAFILFTIAIRSMAGFLVKFPWKADRTLLVILTLAVVSGKGIGGIIADRFGWTKVATLSLIGSAPLMTYCSDYPAFAILGMFLFNFTMPVTLVAISDILPGKPSFAFGLTCLALVIGALPTFFFSGAVIRSTPFIFIIVIISALILFQGLRKHSSILNGN